MAPSPGCYIERVDDIQSYIFWTFSSNYKLSTSRETKKSQANASKKNLVFNSRLTAVKPHSTHKALRILQYFDTSTVVGLSTKLSQSWNRLHQMVSHTLHLALSALHFHITMSMIKKSHWKCLTLRSVDYYTYQDHWDKTLNLYLRAKTVCILFWLVITGTSPLMRPGESGYFEVLWE